MPPITATHLNRTSMATTSSLFLSSPPCHTTKFTHNFWFRSGIRTRGSRPMRLSAIKAESDVRKEDIVIVGGGIAGLATALSLHRLGVPSLVLEQAESLRTSGTSLTLFKNGWRVLDAVGVANDLRPQFLEIQGMVVKSEDGRELRAFNFKEEDQSQEVRAVERRVLLETLAGKLPRDALQFSSKLANIEPTPNGDSLLHLVDGSKLLAKIVIGCDGIRSPIAKWMGFSEPNYSGHCAFRGLGYYPDGHPYEPKVNYIYGQGLRAGFVPVSPTRVYWFICFNSPSPPPRITDPSLLKKEAKQLITNWPSQLTNLVDRTPDETVSRTPLVDRWLWPAITPAASAGRVVVLGDAWHPMTPNLGQGACCALEDSVVLAKKLAGAIKSDDVEAAFRSYESERWPRVFPLTIRANLVGSVLQWENPLVCSLRNNVVIPKLVRLGPLLEHTNFTCDTL